MATDAFPILNVQDLPAVRSFYERLGFAQTYRFPPEGEERFVTLQRHGSVVGLARGSDPGGFAYWVDVADVDALVAELRVAGVEVVEEPRDEPWGERVATIRDPGGTLVHLGAPRATG